MKLISNNTAMERRFNPWIGGSILASLVSVPDLLYDAQLRRTGGLDYAALKVMT